MATLKAGKFAKQASILYDYMASAAWKEDLKQGKGLCLSGNPAIRTDVFLLIAKAFALSGQPTYCVTLHQLVYKLEDDEGRHDIERIANLFLIDFEKDFGAGGCPYTFLQRAGIEDFLSKRRQDQGKHTFFSTAKAWQAGEWWSRDFVSELSPLVQDIILS